MLFDKFKVYTVLSLILILTGLQGVRAQTASDIFTSRECLESSFDIMVSHPGWPMGLTKRKLGVEKKKCVITVTHQKLKVWKRKWEIDVCREPVHIKSGTGAVEVHKRKTVCAADIKGGQSTYCQELKAIRSVLQDDGLIFAEGEKEDLETPHGQIYCSYLLVQKYLAQGRVLSRHDFKAELYPEKSELEEKELKKVLKTPESTISENEEKKPKKNKEEITQEKELEVSTEPRMEPALEGGGEELKSSPKYEDSSKKKSETPPSQSSGGSGSF